MAEKVESESTGEMSGSSLRAVVIGGSGAIGRCLLGELLKSKSFSVITSLGRRSIQVPDSYSVDQPSEESSGRFEQKVVDFENLNTESVGEHFKDKDVFFCALGTTRKDAGSAAAFRHIDYDYVTQCAKIAREQGVKHASLVSSSGANANSMFLYMKTKGEVEEELKKLGFEHTTIFRPGMLDRGEKNRFVEKLAGWFVSGIGVDKVATAMCVDAERLAKKTDEQASLPVDLLFNQDITKLCADSS